MHLIFNNHPSPNYSSDRERLVNIEVWCCSPSKEEAVDFRDLVVSVCGLPMEAIELSSLEGIVSPAQLLNVS